MKMFFFFFWGGGCSKEWNTFRFDLETEECLSHGLWHRDSAVRGGSRCSYMQLGGWSLKIGSVQYM